MFGLSMVHWAMITLKDFYKTTPHGELEPAWPSKILKVFLKALMLQSFLPAPGASTAPVHFFRMQIFMLLPKNYVIFQSLKIL